jgi:hypothetical protein
MLWYKNYQRYHLVGILEIHIMELRKIFWKKIMRMRVYSWNFCNWHTL